MTDIEHLAVKVKTSDGQNENGQKNDRISFGFGEKREKPEQNQRGDH
jgi:hypothetical protein